MEQPIGYVESISECLAIGSGGSHNWMEVSVGEYFFPVEIVLYVLLNYCDHIWSHSYDLLAILTPDGVRMMSNVN